MKKPIIRSVTAVLAAATAVMSTPISAFADSVEDLKSQLQQKVNGANSNPEYTQDLVKTSGIWAEFLDAKTDAETKLQLPNEMLSEETLNQVIQRLDAAMKAADADIENTKKLAAQEKVNGIKTELRKLIDDVTITEDNVFPSVWTTYNAAKTAVENALTNESISYDDIVDLKSKYESELEKANANVPIKAEADSAKEKLSEAIEKANSTYVTQDSSISNELWSTYKEALTTANQMMKNDEALAGEITEVTTTLEDAMAAIEHILTGTVILSDLQSGISASALGLLKDYKFTANVTEFDKYMIIKTSIVDENSAPVDISKIEAKKVNLIIPLVKNFDGIDTVYVYSVANSKYTPIDSSKMTIADGILNLEVDTMGSYAVSRVKLTVTGNRDTSDTQGKVTTSLTDAKTYGTISSYEMDFTGATFSADLRKANDTRSNLVISIKKDGDEFDFGGNTATVSIPLDGTIASAKTLYLYKAESGVYTSVSFTKEWRRISFNVSGSGSYAISSLPLNKDGSVHTDNNTPAPSYTTSTPEDSEDTFTQRQFDNLIKQNSTQDVIIINSEGISFTFGVGTMQSVSDVSEYNFSTKLISDFDDLENPLDTITEKNFVMYIDYAYEGDLPAEAKIRINVGTKYAGKTLYYNQLFSDRAVQVARVIVNKDGFVTVTQDHCSDYVFTTEKIAGEASIVPTIPPSTSGSTTEDDVPPKYTTTATTLTSSDGIQVITYVEIPNGGVSLDVKSIDVNQNTTVFSSFTVKNGISLESILKGKATVRIPLGNKFTDASAIYVYTTESLTPINSQVKGNYIEFDVEDISKLIAISTEKWSSSIPADVIAVATEPKTLTSGAITLSGNLPITATLLATTSTRNTTSFNVSINLRNSKGNFIEFNPEYMTGLATIKLDDDYAGKEKVYVYQVSNSAPGVVYTNAKYTLIDSTVQDNNLTFSIDKLGTYTISKVKLDSNGKYADAEAIEESKEALDEYIKALNIDTSNVDEDITDKFDKYLEEAKAVIKDKYATLDEVEEADTNLRTIVNSIINADKIKTSKAALQEYINDNSDLSIDDQSLQNAYTTALTNAKNVINDKFATLSNIDNAMTDLVNAVTNINNELEVRKQALLKIKEELKDLIDSEVDLSESSEYAIDKYNSAIESATAVYEDENATIEDVQNAITLITEAINATQDIYDVEAITKEINDLLSKEFNADDYTETSYTEYEQAVNNAKDVLANDEATGEMLDEAKTILSNAINNLVEASPEVDKNSDSDNSDDYDSSSGTDNPNTGIVGAGVTAGLGISCGAAAGILAFIEKRKKSKK